jgi:dGTPase
MSRDALEKYESRILAPYAQHSAHSDGRLHEEPLDPPRPNFQRDRDRILHSRAYRRLELKTFLFLGNETRSRLTYATQAAGFARTIARHLALNEDLTEALTLARALGYPPMGCAGAETLQVLMRDHGGYEPLQQSHRILTETETRYPEFNGLNLCAEVRRGLLAFDTLEAQAAVWGERLAHSCYGLEDGLEAGFFSEERLHNLSLWSQVENGVRERYPQLEAERRRYYVLRCLQLQLIEDIVDTTQGQSPVLHLALSPAAAARLAAAEIFLDENLHQHPITQPQRERASHCLRELFLTLISHPHLLEPPFSHRIKKDGLHRAACDFLVWMTDNYAWKAFDQYIGPTEAVPSVSLQQGRLL